MKKKIAIIGAGIGGLTLANLLQKDSEFEFIIYEKEETLNLKEGFGIQLAVNSVFILNKIGFSNLSKVEIYNPLELDFYSNKDKICNLDLSQFNSETEKYTTLKRSILIKFLKEKLFTNAIRFNKTVERVKQNQNTIKIDFKDGESEEVDYLVVSDGVYSQTKSLIENKVFSPNYFGSLAIRTTVHTEKILDFNKMNISLLMSSNAHMVLYPVNTAEHNLVFIVRNKVLNFSDERKLDFIETILEKSILKKNNNLKSLLTGVLNYWPIYTSKDAINSKFKNVFYLGDAFYTLPPTMAQGASQSVEGAMELFQSFKDQNSNKKNLYFTNRLNRIKITKKRSSLNYFAFHFSNKLLVIFRNLLFKKMIKNKKFIENYLGKVFRK
jgi:salicylate hydroxylase